MKDLVPASRGFIEAVHGKTYLDDSAFYGDAKIEKAYSALIRVIRQAMPSDVAWSWDVYEYCMSYADAVRQQNPEIEEAAGQFTSTLERLLEHVSSIEWIACVPLERLFRKFPKVMEFGTFTILNPAGSAPESTDELLETFRSLLIDHCGVEFATPSDPFNNESYLRLGDHYLKKSGHYIPGRPILVVKLGRGDERSNEQTLVSKLDEIVPLLQLCQVALSLEGNLFDGIIGPHSRLPDGKWMDDGLISVPSVAVAINKTNGNCGWWPTRHSIFESQEGEGYEPSRFQTVWQEIAEPIVAFRNRAGLNKCRMAVDNAIRLVGRCRYEEFGNATVNAVIGTETILNPYNPVGDIGERFALMTSALSEASIDGRRTKYRLAKELYKYRCDAVHRSRFFGDVRRRGDHAAALNLFLTCLKTVVTWANGVLEKEAKLDQQAFDAFFVESVIR